MEKYLQSVEKNNCQHKIVYPAKLPYKNDSEIKSCTDKRKEENGGSDRLSHSSKVTWLSDGKPDSKNQLLDLHCATTHSFRKKGKLKRFHVTAKQQR